MAKIIRDIFIGDFGLSQKFGENPKDYAKFGMLGHNGLDFKAPYNTTLIAGTQGRIQKVKYDPNGYGWFVELWDNYQYLVTLYAHLMSVEVKEGQWILAGQKIGTSNNTGNSTGPHLHFGAGDTNESGGRLNQNNGYYGWLNPVRSNWLKWAITNPSTVDEAVRNANPGAKKIEISVDIKPHVIEKEQPQETVLPIIENPEEPKPDEIAASELPAEAISGPFTSNNYNTGVFREATSKVLLLQLWDYVLGWLKKLQAKNSRI